MISLLCALLATLSLPVQHPATLYIATNGNDGWSGSLAAPNAKRTDGPFASITRAQAAVRSRIATGRAVMVRIRGGFYSLPQTLAFTERDSGSSGAPVVYEAFPGEKPVLSGGVRLSGWKAGSNGIWRLNLPEVKSGSWRFSQLWVNGERRYRPRLPRNGYYAIAEGLPPSEKAAGKGIDRFRFASGEIDGGWANLGDVEVLGFQVWTMVRMRIQSVDAPNRVVTFTGNTRGLEAYASLPTGNRYLVENVREALGAPGEFYLDTRTGDLNYVPVPGEDLAHAEVVAPRLGRLVELSGAHHLTFCGLTFAHSNWNSPAEGNAYPQAEVNLEGAITAERARDCRFERCAITHIGIYGVQLGEGCKRNTLENCELTDLGAGGIKIGTTALLDDEERVASHNTLRGCLVAHGGRLHPAAVGVWIGQSHDNRVEGNEIADLYYTGVSVGWTWGYGRSLAHDNLIQDNLIHQIGQGVLSDMGGIYTLGLSPGSLLRGNRIYDIDSFGYGGWGIYPDEGTTGMLIEGNVVFRTKSAGFHQHYGRENIVRDNIFALGREAQLMRTRAEEHLSFTLQHNLIYWNEGALLGSNWSGVNYRLDNNLYWKVGGQRFDFAGETFEQWRARGQDAHSVIADPQFRNPKGGDFRLLPGSPARSLAFKDNNPAAGPRPSRAHAVTRPAFPTMAPRGL